MDLLLEFQKDPDRMSETINSQRSSGQSTQRTQRKRGLSLKAMESMQLPTDSDT